MDMVNILGEMVGNMMVSISSIRNMDLDHILGRMEGSILESGLIVRDMGRGRLCRWMGVRERECGSRTRECVGLMRKVLDLPTTNRLSVKYYDKYRLIFCKFKISNPSLIRLTYMNCIKIIMFFN